MEGPELHGVQVFYQKAREKKVKKAKKAKEYSNDEELDSEGVTIKAIRIGKTRVGYEGYYEYDTAATHHMTNKYDRHMDISRKALEKGGAI